MILGTLFVVEGKKGLAKQPRQPHGGLSGVSGHLKGSMINNSFENLSFHVSGVYAC